jgi:hypothetical protein
VKREPSEHEVQSAILQYLAIKQVMCWRANTGAMSGAHKGKRWFVRFGLPGSPDIFAVIAGQIYGIEVKGPKGKQSESQIEFQARFERAGGKYVLAHSLDDVTAVLT